MLAGILGSTVTYGYGAEGKHGANYIQTTAASVAGMSAMAVVIQAMVWMGLPQPPVLHLVLYMLCIGMYGAGVGMLYTPVLVDRLNLVYPSGLAVANILRALTDPELLKRSVATLGGGMLAGPGRRSRHAHADRLARCHRAVDVDGGRRHGGGRARGHSGAGGGSRVAGPGSVFRQHRLAACRVSHFARSPF